MSSCLCPDVVLAQVASARPSSAQPKLEPRSRTLAGGARRTMTYDAPAQPPKQDPPHDAPRYTRTLLIRRYYGALLTKFIKRQIVVYNMYLDTLLRMMIGFCYCHKLGTKESSNIYRLFRPFFVWFLLQCALT